MKTYVQICDELEEATGKQRTIGAIAAVSLATGGYHQLDKEPAEVVKHPITGVTRQVVTTKPHSTKRGDSFVVNGVTYHPYFPNLAYKVNDVK